MPYAAIQMSMNADDTVAPSHPVTGLWYHSQADPTRAAFPTGHPVVSSKTPEASAKTHTHN